MIMSNFEKFCEDLEAKIQKTYQEGVTLEQAERLAGEFLHAQMSVSRELTKSDLDSRMRKTGVKSIRAAIYLDCASKGEKKPTEAALAAMVDANDLVLGEQKAFDTAEVRRNELERIYNVFANAHVYYRGIAKGSFQ